MKYSEIIIGVYIERASQISSLPALVIAFLKLDRFASNRYDFAHYKAILRKNGVGVLSATEAISQGAEGSFLNQFCKVWLNIIRQNMQKMLCFE